MDKIFWLFSAQYSTSEWEFTENVKISKIINITLFLGQNVVSRIEKLGPGTKSKSKGEALGQSIFIVKHPGEVEGKSTAVHAPILAPGHVKIHLFPNIPDYSKERAILVFPGSDSKSLVQICDEISTTESSEQYFPYTKIVFIVRICPELS